MTYLSDEKPPIDYLAHYGVKGMKWGVRKDRPDGVSRSTNREARKDAEEFARAKLFYGEGAGTRRKLIKATVESKSKRDPAYKKAFDEHLSRQDLGKHASKARKERRRKDATSSTVKTAKGVHRQLTGGFGSVSLAAATLATAYTVGKSSGANKLIADTVKKNLSDIRSGRSNMRAAQDFLKGMGL